MRLWLYMKSYLYIIHNKRKIVNYFMRLIYIDSVSISTHLPSWISWLIDKNYLIYQDNKVFLFRNDNPEIATYCFEVIKLDFFLAIF